MSSDGRFLLRGEPSTGKTMFLRKLCRDWASLHIAGEDTEEDVKEKLSQFTLVLPVILRAVQFGFDLPETLQRQTGMSDTDMFTMMYILSTEPNKVLFILDGLDEYSLDRNQNITEIMKKKDFTRSTCIITTRPEAVIKVKTWVQVYQQAELLGFSKENIKRFIEKFFGSKGENMSEKLFNLIYPDFDYEQDLNVNAWDEIDELQKLAGNPGRLGMLCSIYSYNQELVTNTARLYEEFIVTILSKWEKKQNKKPTPKSKILDNYKDVLKEFGKLAYKQESNGDLKLSFTMEDLEECITPELFNCGFLYKSHPLHRFEDCQMGFIHKSVQEYMAAYFVIHEETGQALDRLLKDFISEDRVENVIPIVKFAIYCGLSKEKIHDLIDYTFINAENKPGILGVLLKLLEQYSLPIHREPVFLGLGDGVDCFVQLPACWILTNLSESMFRSRWMGIQQSTNHKSWVLSWPTRTKKVIIADHIYDDKLDSDPEDDVMFIVYLHRSPLLINGECESYKNIQLVTNGRTHITTKCKDMTKVDLNHSKLHLQTKWLNKLLLNVPNCTELNLKSCGLSPDDIKHFCEETKGCVLKLEILNLENNHIITEEPGPIVSLVRQIPCLKKLYLTSEINTEMDQIVSLVDKLKNVVHQKLDLYIDKSVIAINSNCQETQDSSICQETDTETAGLIRNNPDNDSESGSNLSCAWCCGLCRK